MNKLFSFFLAAAILLSCLSLSAAENTQASLQLGDEKQTLFVGKTITLKPMLAVPKEKASFSYATDNEAIAAVSSRGVIKGIAEGEAVITCTAKTVSGEYTAAISLSVILPVKSITLGKSLTLAIGAVYPLKAEIKPAEASNKGLAWSSSKESVATVDENGVIAAHAAGRATITVSAVDGSKKKATVAVTVKGYDAVIRSRQGAVVEYTTGSGMFSINWKAKKGLAELSSGEEGDTVQLTPLEPGVDSVTISVSNFMTGGTKRFTYDVYIAPTALDHEFDGKPSRRTKQS